MKKITLASLLMFSLSAFATDYPAEAFDSILGDSGIRGPSYQKIMDELYDLQTSYPDLAQTVHYGSTVENRKLTIIKIAKRNAPLIKGAKAIYIGGSIHGNEYLNIEDRLPRWFLQEGIKSAHVQTFLNQGGAIYIAPILNPDGYDRHARSNSNGEDLNRDYTVQAANTVGFKQPETKSLIDHLSADLLMDGRTLKLAWDYHCCAGALLYPWSFKGPVLPTELQKVHKTIGSIMQKNLGKLKVGTTPTILGYDAFGTSKDFYFERFGAISFTFEGRVRTENRYFADHTKMWLAIVEQINLQ